MISFQYKLGDGDHLSFEIRLPDGDFKKVLSCKYCNIVCVGSDRKQAHQDSHFLGKKLWGLPFDKPDELYCLEGCSDYLKNDKAYSKHHT